MATFNDDFANFVKWRCEDTGEDERFERILAEYKSPLSDTEQTLYLKGFTDGVFLALDAINK